MASSSPTAIASSPVKATTKSLFRLWLAVHLLWWRHPMSSSSFRPRQAAEAVGEPRVADGDASNPNLSRCDHLLRRFLVLLTIDIRSSSVASDNVVAAWFPTSPSIEQWSNPPFDGEDTLLDLFVSDGFLGGRSKVRASESIDHSEELIAILEPGIWTQKDRVGHCETVSSLLSEPLQVYLQDIVLSYGQEPGILAEQDGDMT